MSSKTTSVRAAKSRSAPAVPGSVEILDGLVEGEVVVVEGTQKVADAGAVRPVTQAEFAGRD